MVKVLYILLAILILLLLITVHEFGHYIAGKILKFKIDEFSIGFGPALYQKKKKSGEYFSIRAFPLGGYCAFNGEDEDGKESDGSFNKMKPWKRIIVLLAGVTFNFLFGVIAVVVFLLYNGFAIPMVTNVANNAATTPINLQRGDVIVAVDGKSLEAYRSFADLNAKYQEGEEYTITVNRNGELVNVTVQKHNAFYFVANQAYFDGKLFVYDAQTTSYKALDINTFCDNVIAIETTGETAEENGRYDNLLNAYLATVYVDEDGTKTYADSEYSWLVTGNDTNASVISFVNSDTASLGVIQAYVTARYGFFEALGKAWPYSFYFTGLIWNALVGIFTGATALKDMGGTITAVTQIAEISSMSLSHILLIIPLLAFNLALFNILPFPSLDGARTLGVLWEWITKKPVNRKVESIINMIGLILLLGLIIFFDVYHFFIAAKLLI